jgi:hypothetical protein
MAHRKMSVPPHGGVNSSGVALATISAPPPPAASSKRFPEKLNCQPTPPPPADQRGGRAQHFDDACDIETQRHENRGDERIARCED